jgi:hypothetical protein
MDLTFLRDRRTGLAAAAAVVAIGAGLLPGCGRRGGPGGPGGESDAGALQVEMSAAEPSQDKERQVRCFAGAQYAGMMSLAECARRNGVAPGAMDVGLDAAGAPVAEPGAPSDLPPSDQAVAAEPAAAPAAAAPVGVCWLSAGGWRKIGDGMTLDACVQALFSGRCAAVGTALYGRWGTQTLRLVPGRVERSGDNRNFQPLAAQPPGTCVVPHLPE